jgi:hypothetical protein
MLSRAELIGTYYERMEHQEPSAMLAGLTEYVPSGAASNIYKMTGMVPRLKERTGATTAEALTINSFEIRNKDYEAALRIPRNDLRRDQTGQLNSRISEFSLEGEDHWFELMATLIENGTSGVCYTGQPFFSASHSEGESGTYSNLWTGGLLNVGSPTAPTAYEFALAVMSLIPLFYAYKDDRGRPRNRRARKFLVTVPVGLMGPALSAMSNPVLDTGSGTVNNPMKNPKFQIDVDVDPNLTWTDSFTIARTDSNLKALIRQEEEKVTPEVFGPESEYFRLNREALIKIFTSRNMGYGCPWLMGKATFS